MLAAPPARAGETGCWFEHGAVVVPAAFGDIAGDFIFDLSAPRSQLHVTTAQAHGIEDATSRAELAVAGERIGNFPIEVADLDARSWPFVTNIAGVLGADLARRFVIEIQFSPCRLVLGDRHPPARPRGRRLEIRWTAGVPTVRASICDNRQCETGLFAIDTASPGVRLSGAALSRSLGAPEATSRSTPPARLRALSLAGLFFEQTPAGLIDQASPGMAGTIGDAVWSNFRLTLDARHGWLELRQPTPALDRSGLVPDVAPDGAVAAVKETGEDHEEDHHRQP